MVGATISHYRVTDKLGEGGMGVVYKAEDTNLKRPVALKFLADHLLGDEEIKARFRREAEAAAGLNHPNICTVHEIAEAGGRTFIAMAFLEGEGLDKKIEAGPLKLSDALSIAIQTVHGLQAAHEKGIVHRDIKPANLMVTGSGPKQLVTIMDFGLALLADRSKLTRLDETMGTVTYMSPEQTYGADIDHRSDIWSLGVVIYEMVTGQQPFKGHYDKAVMYSITSEEPEPMTGLRTGVPMELELLVNKCLAKQADRRYQSTADMVVDLESLSDKLKSGRSTILRAGQSTDIGALPAAPAEAQSTTGDQAQLSASRRPGVLTTVPARRDRLGWAAAAVLLVLCSILAVVHFRATPPKRTLYEFAISVPQGARFRTFSLSPDGRHLAIAASNPGEQSQLWVRSLDSLEFRELPGTEEASYPFWSPDSRYIGFFAKGKLKKVALTGGPPQSLCDAEDGRGGSWNSQGVIIFSPQPFGEIHRVSDAGGEPVAITSRGESQKDVSRRFPHFLPDGHHFLHLDRSAQSEETGIKLGSLNSMAPKHLLADQSNAVFAPSASNDTGVILFWREGNLMAQPFDARALEFSGDVFPITEDVARTGNLAHYGFSASNNGTLVYRSGLDSGALTQLGWFDREGNLIEALGDPALIRGVALSPDAKRAALHIAGSEAGAGDIWLFEFERGIQTQRRFTSHPGPDRLPVWSPDGAWIAFSSEREGPETLYRKSAGGVGKAEALLPPGLPGLVKRPTDWSRDGRFVSYNANRNLWVLPMEGDRTPFPYLETEFRTRRGRFSPDSRWIAYEYDSSGTREIYVRTFPKGDQELRISPQGGFDPRWRADGKELYYVAPDGTLMAVSIQRDDTLKAGVPEPLFEVRAPFLSSGIPWPVYDVTADGQRFLVANLTEEADNPSLTVTTNWPESMAK
jgi:serine/threonine protein kinase/Tol biopolymer transport system component